MDNPADEIVYKIKIIVSNVVKFKYLMLLALLYNTLSNSRSCMCIHMVKSMVYEPNIKASLNRIIRYKWYILVVLCKGFILSISTMKKRWMNKHIHFVLIAINDAQFLQKNEIYQTVMSNMIWNELICGQRLTINPNTRNSQKIPFNMLLWYWLD